MSGPRYMLSIEVAGNKRYCRKLKTRVGNHEMVHQETHGRHRKVNGASDWELRHCEVISERR